MPDIRTFFTSSALRHVLASATRSLQERMRWALTGVGLALLILLVLPSAQIKLGASQLQGLIGSYTSGGWVPCDANGTPLPSGDPGLNSDGSAALLHTGSQPTASNTYPVPQTGADPWWYGCYSPRAPGGGPYPSGGGSYPGSGGGLSTSSSAGNSVTGQTGGLSTIGYYDPVYFSGDRPGNSPTPPDLNGSVSTNGSDTLKAHFLWTGPGPAPSSATFIIQTSVSASASVGYGSSGKASGLSATTTGTIGSDTVTATAGDAGSAGSQAGGSYQAQQVSASGGIATVSLSASVSTTTKNTLAYATWTGSSSSTYYYAGPGAGQTGASASVTVKGAVYTTNLIPSGAVMDVASGQYHILIGQQCSPSLDVSNGGTPSNMQWKATGNTVQASSWNVSTDNNSAKFSGLVNPYTLTQATTSAAGPIWYWDDNSGPQTVTCTATVTPPSGKGKPFPVSLTQQVTVDAPTFKNNEPVGTVYLDTKLNFSQYYGTLLLHAGDDRNPDMSSTPVGISFDDTVNMPFSAIYGRTGSWFHLQLISVSRYRTPKGSSTAIGMQGNSVKEALDNVTLNNGAASYILSTNFDADGVSGKSQDNDNPVLQPQDDYYEYNIKNEAFHDYIMYQAPGANSIPVPLADFNWSWNVDVKIPNTALSSWSSTPTTGTITGAGTATRQLNYPVWPSLRNFNWLSP